MSPHISYQVLVDLTLGESTDYRNTYDAGLLQGVPRSLNRDPLGLEADNLPFHGMDTWTLCELLWLNTKGLSQVAVGRAEPDYTNVNLTESKSLKLCLNSSNQTRSNNWNEVCQVLEHDLSTCAQGKVSVTLYRLDELEGRPIGHFNGTYTDDQDTTIGSYKFTTDYLEGVTSGEKIVEETLTGHLLKSDRLITYQPDRGSIRIQYHGRQTDREKLLRYLTPFRHHNEFHEQCAERIFNDLLHFYQPEKLSVYACYTRRGGLDISPWHSNNDFIPSTTRPVR